MSMIRTSSRETALALPTRISGWMIAPLASVTLLTSCAASSPVGTSGPSPDRSPSAAEHTYSGPRHAPFITVAEFKPMYDSADPNHVLVDVRSADARAESHIRGDIWVPLSDAAKSGWKALRRYKDGLIVLYCACPSAEASSMSVILRRHGFSFEGLRVLREGLPGWEAAGYPVTTGADPCLEYAWPSACASHESA
jgi:rhodanese-related sulfurtransferase